MKIHCPTCENQLPVQYYEFNQWNLGPCEHCARATVIRKHIEERILAQPLPSLSVSPKNVRYF